MIVFGSHELLPYIGNDFIVKNLSSYRTEYRRDLNLIPPIFMNYDDKDFDIRYAEYILLNNNCFYELITNLVYPGIYIHADMYILVHRDDDIFDKLTDSLQKFIQQRYGITTYLVNSYEDIYTILTDSSICTSTREPYHIHNLDDDMKRYSEMII